MNASNYLQLGYVQARSREDDYGSILPGPKLIWTLPTITDSSSGGGSSGGGSSSSSKENGETTIEQVSEEFLIITGIIILSSV